MVLYIVANALIILISVGACMYSINQKKIRKWIKQHRRKKQEKNVRTWEEFHNNLNKKNKERHMDG